MALIAEADSPEDLPADGVRDAAWMAERILAMGSNMRDVESDRRERERQAQEERREARRQNDPAEKLRGLSIVADGNRRGR